MKPAIPDTLILLFLLLVVTLVVFLAAGLNRVLKNWTESRAKRRKILILTLLIIVSWISLISYISTINFLNDFSVLPPRMALILFPPLMTVVLLVFSKKIFHFLSFVPQPFLVFIHTARFFIGLIFYKLYLIEVIPVQMTFIGKNFDIISGAIAPIAGMLILKKRISRIFLVAFDLTGLLLLAMLPVMAILSSPYPFRIFHDGVTNTIMAYFPFVLMPGFVVPFFFAMHAFSLIKTLKKQILLSRELRDFWMRAAGIPLITLSVTMFLHRDITWLSPDFAFFVFISMGYTIFLWYGDRLIITEFRSRFPHYNQTVKRNIYQAIFVTLFTVFSVIVIDRFLVIYIFHYLPSFVGTFEDVLIGMVISLLMLVIYESVYFFRKWKDNFIAAGELERKRVQNKLDSLKNQINPHFLFNSLNSLSLLIREDKSKASLFVQEMSQVYRYILQCSENDFSPLEKELQFLKSYMFLQRIRFNDNVDESVQVNEKLLSGKIPSLSLQVLIDNAIMHNVISKQKPLHIKIYTTDDGNLIVSNNFQKKNRLVPSFTYQITHLQKRYEKQGFLTMEILENEKEFSVILPVIS